MISGFEFFEKAASEQPPQYLDRCEIGFAADFPAAAVDIEAGVGDHGMNVRMELQTLIPGMQHCGDADVGTEAFRIGADGDESFGAGAKQDVEHQLAVGEGDADTLLWKDEDQVEARRRQHFAGLLEQPLLGGAALAGAAVAIATGVVQHMAAVTARAVVVPCAQRRGSTLANGIEHLPDAVMKRVSPSRHKGFGGVAEDVGHAGLVKRHRLAVQNGGWVIQALEHGCGGAGIDPG